MVLYLAWGPGVASSNLAAPTRLNPYSGPALRRAFVLPDVDPPVDPFHSESAVLRDKTPVIAVIVSPHPPAPATTSPHQAIGWLGKHLVVLAIAMVTKPTPVMLTIATGAPQRPSSILARQHQQAQAACCEA